MSSISGALSHITAQEPAKTIADRGNIHIRKSIFKAEAPFLYSLGMSKTEG